jgi:hypothetical protein
MIADEKKCDERRLLMAIPFFVRSKICKSRRSKPIFHKTLRKIIMPGDYGYSITSFYLYRSKSIRFKTTFMYKQWKNYEK